MKVEFTMTLFDDAHVKEKLEVMSALEAMMDDSRNVIPEEYYYFDDLPLGTKVQLTLEVVE